MFPIKDNIPSRSFPIITVSLIVITVFIFFLENLLGDPFILKYALIPTKVDIFSPITLLPFLTSIFLHAGWLHLISNMWFLWIFGDNIEDKFGRFWFLVFYLFCGLAAGIIQYTFIYNIDIPNLGASGAIAGVLGAYFLIFPRAKIHTLVFIFFFATVITLPAGIVLGFWFLTQLFNGTLTVTTKSLLVEGGVAWWAHIGGFLTGLVVAWIYKNRYKGYVNVENNDQILQG
ncbi:MAG: rhomboid family intramembrane serine protease [Candidatus Aenigmarchaeota archaeon]|nr:rhomboid family intramembrane serine protease [Candidatus Aenigmarchaeota archaeon]